MVHGGFSVINQGKRARRWAATKDQKLAQGLAQTIEVGDCLEWQGEFMCHGVTPSVMARNTIKERTDNYSVPRELWIAAYGEIPAGRLVYRNCCNNACVLLDHLSIGTRKECGAVRRKAGTAKHNMATKLAITMAARNRAVTVNSMGKAREVRDLRAGKTSHADIALMTGVSSAMVSDICQGRRWVEHGGVFSGLGARA